MCKKKALFGLETGPLKTAVRESERQNADNQKRLKRERECVRENTCKVLLSYFLKLLSVQFGCSLPLPTLVACGFCHVLRS